MELKLAHDVGAVSLGRFDTDTQGDSNFLTALALGKQLNDFALARSEPARSGRLRLNGSGIAFGEIVKEHVGSASGEESAIADESLDGIDEIAVSVGLHDVGASTGLDDVFDELIGEVQSKHDDAGLRQGLVDAAGSFQAIKIRHTHVHDNNIGFVLFSQSDGFTTGFGLSANFPIRTRG